MPNHVEARRWLHASAHQVSEASASPHLRPPWQHDCWALLLWSLVRRPTERPFRRAGDSTAPWSWLHHRNRMHSAHKSCNMEADESGAWKLASVPPCGRFGGQHGRLCQRSWCGRWRALQWQRQRKRRRLAVRWIFQTPSMQWWHLPQAKRLQARTNGKPWFLSVEGHLSGQWSQALAELLPFELPLVARQAQHWGQWTSASFDAALCRDELVQPRSGVARKTTGHDNSLTVGWATHPKILINPL